MRSRNLSAWKGSSMNQKILNKEEQFHDQWAAGVDIQDVHPIEAFTACTAPENRRIVELLGDVCGKKILELGCGLGEASIYFAMNGGDVTASDLSEGMLEVASNTAKRFGVTIKTQKCSADDLPFADYSFDVVYAANLLHHVNIEDTLYEARRVLKKGGIFVSWDPLAHNPVINIYRRMAVKVRTKDEHPLKMKELRIFKKYFSEVSHDCTWLFTLWIFLKYYFIDHVDMNQERYWKKIITDHEKLKPIYIKLEKIDKKLLNLFPVLKRYCWNIVVFCQK